MNPVSTNGRETSVYKKKGLHAIQFYFYLKEVSPPLFKTKVKRSPAEQPDLLGAGQSPPEPVLLRDVRGAKIQVPGKLPLLLPPMSHSLAVDYRPQVRVDAETQTHTHARAHAHAHTHTHTHTLYMPSKCINTLSCMYM